MSGSSSELLAGDIEIRDASGRFLKKAPQNFFAPEAGMFSTPETPGQKSFCGAFFKKRPLSFVLPTAWMGASAAMTGVVKF